MGINKIISHHSLTTLLVVLLFGALLRFALFSGFVLGDDPAYADYAARILRGSYPPIGTHGVFAARPLLLYPLAASLRLFGWQEWSFILPILLASLINIVIVYSAGLVLSGAMAGCLGAVAYATFPLDVVHSTTMSNDILLSTYVWGGGLLYIIACKYYEKLRFVVICGLSGFIVGAAIAVKFNALFSPLLFVGAALLALPVKSRYRAVGAWTAGWLLANCLVCLFLYSVSGDFFAHYHAEMKFNLDYNPSGYIADKKHLINFLLLYPRWIAAAALEGHTGYKFAPYGYFFLAFMFSLPLAFLKKFSPLRLPALCTIFYLLVMQFAPLKLLPEYIPIHRLPRFLHIAAIPAAVTLGIAVSIIISESKRAGKITAVLLFLTLIISSLYWSWLKASFYQDCAQEQRWAWEIANHTAAQKIITDREMRNYFMFRSGFVPSVPIEAPDRLPQALPSDVLIIAGGARRPDMHPFYAADWEKRLIGQNLQLIAEAPFPRRPWRTTTLRIYQSVKTAVAQDVPEENCQGW